MMTTFVTTSTVISEIYDVNAAVVNTCASLFFISFVILNFAAVYVIERMGCTFCCKTSAIVIIVAAWGRFEIMNE